MIEFLKLLPVLLAFTDARIATLDNNTVEGELVRITASEVIVRSGNNDVPVELNSVTEVSLSADSVQKDEPSPALAIDLADGASLTVKELTATSESVTAISDNLGQLQIPRPAIRSVRLQPAKEEWEAEWQAFRKRTNSKDLLVVPKRDGSGLDFLAGVVSSIQPETVPFLLDGDEIPVPRERVFGIVFAVVEQEATRLSGDTSVQFHDGTVVKTAEVRLQDGTVSVQAAWGQQLSFPVDRVASFDFSGGRIHFLSDLDPISERYFGLQPDGLSWGVLFEADRTTRDGMSRLWKMSRDHFPNSGRPPLTLRRQTYRKGLCIFPSAKIEFPLDEKYSTFSATVGVDDEVAFNQLSGKPATAVELAVEADGIELFRQLINAPDDPIDLNLDIAGATTLTIVVDFGDGSSTCDYLDLANARLIVDTSAN